MKRPEFIECVTMLRSTNSMTYEDGYQWLQGYIESHIDELIELMLDEHDSNIRSKFVELVGGSQLKKVVPYLKKELSNESSEVRQWAYTSLLYFEDADAVKLAETHALENPNEEFL